ncbi:LysR family transcriptional regulator [Tistrella mobilis]|jgi:DNA-binding transcriptional LysR family regulator|uniref:LysR family transcriptional regulator n=1 Tax=Tistrella mobilis TaxID=171437 RepID=UPI0035565D44
MTLPPDWRSLQILLAAIDCGSVTRAAGRCGIAVSAAAKRIQDLEAELGVRLLDRVARGVTPTPEGEVLARHARAMFAFGDRLADDLRAVAGGGLGRVRLAATMSVVAGHPLPQALAAFARARPGIEVDLIEGTSLAILSELVEGRADLGIITIGTALPEGLTGRPWGRDRLLAVVPAGHPIAGREGVSLGELLHEPLIEIIEGGAITLLLNDMAERAGLSPRTAFRVATVDSAIRMVAAGQGVAVIPDGVFDIFSPALGLVGVAIAEPWAHRRLRLVGRAPAVLPPAARLLHDHLAGLNEMG